MPSTSLGHRLTNWKEMGLGELFPSDGCPNLNLARLIRERTGDVSRASEGVKESWDEQKRFTQRRKVKKAQRKQNSCPLRALRLCVLA